MSKALKKIRIGVMSYENYKQRTLAIARGDYTPSNNEPKIWFNSMRSLASVLSEDNQLLLQLILDSRPQSISELEAITGRKANNLLRTLRTMEKYGLVALNKHPQQKSGRAALIPEVLYDPSDIQINLKSA